MYVFKCLLVLIALGTPYSYGEHTRLSIIHINDFHARFEETTWESTACTENCIGGFSRMYKAVTDLKKDFPNAIVLNGGDNFQGTLWYNIHKWKVIQHFMNKIPHDAIVLGNHEFDDKIAGVVPFIKNLEAPVIVSNIDDSEEPTLQGIYNKSIVVEREGKRIGIIGVLTSITPSISNVEKLRFLDESESINAEAERLVKEEGVFTNIVLSHCGYDVDQKLAAKATAAGKISIIVGGHSHTLLYTGDDVPGPDRPGGPYPTEIKNLGGKTVLITQASCFSKYVGNFSVVYDESGEYVSWDGKPIFMDNSLKLDVNITEELKPWKEEVDKIGQAVLGETLVDLDKSDCRYAECLLGNFVTDAMLSAYANETLDYGAISFMNSGGLRTNIAKGNITYSDLVTSQPFENTVDAGFLKGHVIKEIFEFAAKPYDFGRVYVSLTLVQVSGIKVVLDLNKPLGERVTSLKVLCLACPEPTYMEIDLEYDYRVIVPSFLTRGGDGFTMFPDNIQNLTVGDVDIDVFTKYIAENTPIYEEKEQRITILGNENIITRNMD